MKRRSLLKSLGIALGLVFVPDTKSFAPKATALEPLKPIVPTDTWREMFIRINELVERENARNADR